MTRRPDPARGADAKPGFRLPAAPARPRPRGCLHFLRLAVAVSTPPPRPRSRRERPLLPALRPARAPRGSLPRPPSLPQPRSSRRGAQGPAARGSGDPMRPCPPFAVLWRGCRRPGLGGRASGARPSQLSLPPHQGSGPPRSSPPGKLPYDPEAGEHLCDLPLGNTA